MIELDQGGRARQWATTLPPDPALRGIIEHTTLLRAADMPGAGPWRIVPDPAPHLLAYRYRDGRTRAVLVGPRTTYIDVDQTDRLFLVGVRLRPGTLPLLSGLSAWDFRDQTVPLEDILGPRGPTVVSRLADTADPRDVVSILHAMLGATRDLDIDWRVHGMMTLLQASPARPIRALAEVLGAGERTLRNVAQSTVGLRPKEWTRIVRLHHAVAVGLAGHTDAEAAHRSGYADQAHYIHDSHRLLGETPADFRSRGCRFLQDPAD